jgi:hypothetical protein
MVCILAIGLSIVLGWGSVEAGTVVYSSLTGTHFAFNNMTEVGGDHVVPPGLEQPRLFTSPYDSIKFSPSMYVALENNGPIPERSTSSSTLTLTLDSLAGAVIQEFSVSVAGTYGMELYQSAPTGLANVGLSLGLDFTYGSTTVSNLMVPVYQNTNDKTWSGIRTFTANDLATIFSQPTLQVQQLVITANPTVSAEALYANARSQINYLDFTVVPIPEPSSWQLVLAALSMGLLHRKWQTKALINDG